MVVRKRRNTKMSIVVESPTLTARKQQIGPILWPELDWLRFFAFFGVFIFHATPRRPIFYDGAGIPRWLAGVVMSVTGAGVYGSIFFLP